MSNTFNKVLVLIILPVTVTVGGWLALNGSFGDRSRQLAEKHQAITARLEQDWTRGQAQREHDVRNAALERARRFDQELTAAMGSAAAAAAKNPELSIGSSIQQIAQACAPAGSQIHVSVERFTEFMASIELSQHSSQREIADATRCILGQTSGYRARCQCNHVGRVLR